jgi:Lrp/AsnC family transcriptional regulator, regulator for asnA, asnC and gidA
LIADGRKNAKEIAEKIGVRKETVKSNYQKLEKVGIIQGATIHINYGIFGYKAVAHMLITVKPEQEDQLIEYLKGKPEVYSSYGRGIKGKIDVVAILRTLGHLNEIKDAIKSKFSVLEMKTVIWTDVKEMNQNLAIIDENRKTANEIPNNRTKNEKKPKLANIRVDEVDQKIADKLAQDGRIPILRLAKEVGISAMTAKRKYERLKERGALKVTIQIDATKIGYQALCVFFIVTSGEEVPIIIEKISTIPDVISIMKTTGDYDLQVYAMVQNLDQLLFIQEEIERIHGIAQMDAEILRLKMSKWPSPKQCISTF